MWCRLRLFYGMYYDITKRALILFSYLESKPQIAMKIIKTLEKAEQLAETMGILPTTRVQGGNKNDWI